MKNKTIWQSIMIASMALLSLTFLSNNFLLKVEAQDIISSQNDAIGIRVVPNPNHYSIFRWYESQGYSGSPQALTVDGYEALRDGRTVYINAAHVVPSDKEIFTNIYLISYNQDQSNLTTDILGQIISHWKFNDNLNIEDGSNNSTCSISALKCSSDVDCPSSQSCDLAKGVCKLEKDKNCQVDEDCPTNFFCSNLKSKIIRDIKRVGKIEELRESLAKYREKNGNYPKLSAGTYLPGVSTSLWPSWQADFLPALSMEKSFFDPINRFGTCEGFDTKTCWNKDKQRFPTSKEGLILKLPSDSYALVYTTNDSGSEYNLCAAMESRELGYSFNPMDPKGSDCVLSTGIVAGGNAYNRAPQITANALGGTSGLEYNGFIKASDPDNDPLTWSLETMGDFSSWSSAPVIKSTNDPLQKKLFASSAGSSGIYPIKISVTDDKNETTSQTLNIEIKEAGTLTEASEYIYRLDPLSQFNYSFYVSGLSGTPSPTIRLVSGDVNILSLPGIKMEESNDGINRKKINYKGIFDYSLEFKEDIESIYSVSLGGKEVSRFTIKLKVDRPVLDFNCDNQLRVGYDYDCYLGSSSQGNHTVAYEVANAPSGIEIIEELDENESLNYFLRGKVNQPLKEKIIISATNEYKTENSKFFDLNVNTYCGDGVLQGYNFIPAIPNTEGRGGMYNNGYESCDGKDNVTRDPALSSKTMQYACNTPEGSITPYPITTTDYCIFKSPLDGGGYCGDSYCQVGIEKDGEKDYCPFDCDPNYDIKNDVFEGGAEPDEGCSIDVPCHDGYTCNTITGLCEINCFTFTETTRSILFNEGDATRPNIEYVWHSGGKHRPTFTSKDILITNTQGSSKVCYGPSYDRTKSPYWTTGSCSVIKLDNPQCIDGRLPVSYCPAGFRSYIKYLGNTPGKTDRCRIKSASWRAREKYQCFHNEEIKRCFGDPCRSTLYSETLDGIVSASGKCLVPPPPPPIIPECSSTVRYVQCVSDGGPGNTRYNLEYCNSNQPYRYFSYDDYSPGHPCELITTCCDSENNRSGTPDTYFNPYNPEQSLSPY